MQIDYLLDYDGAEGTFGGISFDSLPYGLARNPDVPGWIAHNPTIDSNGPTPGGMAPLYAINGDLGMDDQDLQYIVATVTARLTTDPLVDPRLKIGMEDPLPKAGLHLS